MITALLEAFASPVFYDVLKHVVPAFLAGIGAGWTIADARSHWRH